MDSEFNLIRNYNHNCNASNTICGADAEPSTAKSRICRSGARALLFSVNIWCIQGTREFGAWIAQYFVLPIASHQIPFRCRLGVMGSVVEVGNPIAGYLGQAGGEKAGPSQVEDLKLLLLGLNGLTPALGNWGEA
jgi:hypothetical protein